MGPWPTACLIEDNIFHALTLMISLEGAPSGNVIAYNYLSGSLYNDPEWGRQTIGTHGAHPIMNLIEGNLSEDKFTADFYWGTSSHQTYFRNRMFNAPGKIYGSWGLDLYVKQHYYNVVGNVFGSGLENRYELTGDFNYMADKSIFKLGFLSAGTASAAGSDPMVKSTLLRHGNWDSVTNGVVWHPEIADRLLPDSLYLSAKPAWFGSHRWPPIGADLNPMVSSIPAESRYQALQGPKPKPPTDVRVAN